MDTQTHIPTCESKQFQEIRHARPLAMHTWFKNSARDHKNELNDYEF